MTPASPAFPATPPRYELPPPALGQDTERVLADPRWIPIDVAIGSAMWMPVLREDHLFGVMCVSSGDKNAFSPEDQRLPQDPSTLPRWRPSR